MAGGGGGSVMDDVMVGGSGSGVKDDIVAGGCVGQCHECICGRY